MPTKASNVLSREELRQIKSRFIAEKLVANVVLRQVPVRVKADRPQEETTWRVSGRLVNARSGPATSHEVLAKLERGTIVEGAGETDGSWVKVIVQDSGETVWIHGNFLTENL
jgi:uncharacterized protein YgiM (DUF1202 family)